MTKGLLFCSLFNLILDKFCWVLTEESVALTDKFVALKPRFKYKSVKKLEIDLQTPTPRITSIHPNLAKSLIF